MENYALNVASGVCTWCGYDAGADPELAERVREFVGRGKERMAGSGMAGSGMAGSGMSK